MNYPVCLVADVLTPEKFFVVSAIPEQVEEINKLENQMKLEMMFEDGSECPFSINMYVAVKDFTRQLRRGVIQKGLKEGMFEVLLIDYGRVIETSKTNLIPITNQSFTEPQALSFLVRLYGIIPTTRVYVDGIKKPRACLEWSPESIKFVKSILKVDQEVTIKKVLIQDETVYGDLFFKPQPDMKPTSLRKLLCKQDFCTYSESNFLRLRALNAPSEYVDHENKEKTNEASSALSVPNASSCSSNESSSGSFVGQPKSIGLGRGKLKMLIAEMKKSESLGKDQRCPDDSLTETGVRRKKTETVGNEIPSEVKENKPGKHFKVSDSNAVSEVGLLKKHDLSILGSPEEEKFNKKQSSKQNFNESLKPNTYQSSKQNFNESSKQNFNESSKQNFYQSSKQNFNESSKQNFKESSKQNFKESSKQNFNESSKPNFYQTSKQNFNESSKPNFYQNSKQNFYQSPKQSFYQGTIPNFYQSPIPKFFHSQKPNFYQSPIPKFYHSQKPNFYQSPIPKFYHSQKPNFYQSPKQDVSQSSKQDVSQSPKQDVSQSPKQDVSQSSKQDVSQSPKQNFYQNSRHDSKQTSQEIFVPKKPPNRRADPNDSESTSGSTYSAASNSFKLNIKAWTQPLNSIKFNSWDPYVMFYDTIVEPFNTFKELPIRLSIIQNLEREGAFRDLSQVQRWAIPSIRRQLNTVIIGSSKCGKTLSYILPIIDYIQDSTYFEELPRGNGPYVVILTSSSSLCESIYYFCHLLLGNSTKMKIRDSSIKIVAAHGNGCEEEIWVKLTNGCHILISTPPCLVRLLEYPILTNFERLTCLVLDEIDIISQNPFQKNLRIILEKARFATKDRSYQCILAGERWTPSVEKLVKTYMKPETLIIGSSIEAVIFKKLKPQIHIVDRKQKLDTVLILLEGKLKRLKTVVVCEGRAEASRLNDFLTRGGISSHIAHERMMADELKEIHLFWKISFQSVLISTDEVLHELNIKEAQALVHFELPSRSKTNFYLRYTILEGFFWDACSSSKKKSKDFGPENIILLDDENHRQLPHIIDFVARLGGKIPPKILEKCQEIRRMIEIEKSDSPICQNLLAIGRCRNSKNCRERHALVKDLDSSTDLPTSGWVNFIFLKSKHASCFYVELFEHIDSKGNITKIENRRSEMLEKVAKYFRNEANQRTLGIAKCGDVCAVMTYNENEKVFHRAKVVEILKVDKNGNALEVVVKLLDEGVIWERKSTELFELPIHLSSHPQTATDVWAVGIQPKDFDVTWSAVANQFVSDLMSQKLQNNQYWSGKIVLALNNTLFLDPIKRKEFLPALKIHVFDLDLQCELLNKGIAVANKEHLPALLELCATGNMDFKNTEERKNEDLSVFQPQSAFFDSDFPRVIFLGAENTSLVFLQPHKFDKLLQNLEDDCEKEAAEVMSHKTKESKLVKFTPGMFCLAPCEDGKWNRGRIESENETDFKVYFIDHGDILFVSKNDVLPISQSLLLKLPAQAIECSLVGIQMIPSGEECSDEVLREIYTFTDDGLETLYAYIVDKDLQSSFTNGRKYKLNLLNSKGISLNKILVDKGMVFKEESEEKYLEDIEIGGSDDDEEKVGEAETIEGGEIPLLDHFNNLNVENEETLEFLKEFASKFLLSSTPLKTDILKKETHLPLQKPDIAYKAQEKTPVEPENQQKTQIEGDSQEEPTPKTSKNTQKDINNLKLKSRENVLTPSVLWCQNHTEVQIKILLGNVEDYNLDCTVHNLSFRCSIKEKFYAVDLKLFGAIIPEKTKVTIKTFHVTVVLTKLTFPLWPRLHADKEKHGWINLDVESLADNNDVFSDRIQSVKTAIESGLVKETVKSVNVKPVSDSEEEEINIEDEENQDLD